MKALLLLLLPLEEEEGEGGRCSEGQGALGAEGSVEIRTPLGRRSAEKSPRRTEPSGSGIVPDSTAPRASSAPFCCLCCCCCRGSRGGGNRADGGRGRVGGAVMSVGGGGEDVVAECVGATLCESNLRGLISCVSRAAGGTEGFSEAGSISDDEQVGSAVEGRDEHRREGG